MHVKSWASKGDSDGLMIPIETAILITGVAPDGLHQKQAALKMLCCVKYCIMDKIQIWCILS